MPLISAFFPAGSTAITANLDGYDQLSAANKATIDAQIAASKKGTFKQKPKPKPIARPTPGMAAGGGVATAAAAAAAGAAGAGASAGAGSGAGAGADDIPDLAPLELGVCKIEYAKAKKPSNCKSCSMPIKNGKSFGKRERERERESEGDRARERERAREGMDERARERGRQSERARESVVLAAVF